MSEEKVRDGGFDDWLDAIEAGEPYYFECDQGHGGLPPCRVCPECGAPDIEQSDLPDTGTIDTYTILNVAAPQFADETPYATAIADFGPVRLTAVTRGIEHDDIEVGGTVGVDVETTETTSDRVLVFRPQ